ncbi:MAG: fumarylacetoacetate hydrolase family protein [Chloroflexi bacterium]|nr:fumarylacetoacetate hydrolase family protein [Chloroflexota bacterium]
MKIIRYRIGRSAGYGVEEGGTVYAAHGSLRSGFRQGQVVAPLADVKILPPVKPSKVLAIGRNYLEHAEELGNSLPPEPLLFIKAPTAVIGMGDPIVLPKDAGRIDYEAELVAIIGRPSSDNSHFDEYIDSQFVSRLVALFDEVTQFS